jgi:hypothetical protein
MRSHRIWLVVVAVVVALAAMGGAYAAGKDGNNPTNAPVPNAAPPSIIGTTTGMPPTAQLWFAVVNADGSIARGFPSTPLTGIHISTGTYEVDFKTGITSCAYTGAIGLSGTSGASAPGMITVVGRAGNPKGIFVQTYNASGALTDLGFHVEVAC